MSTPGSTPGGARAGPGSLAGMADDVMDWDSAYRGEAVFEGPPPWNIGEPQPELATLIDSGAISGAVLDAGCGHAELGLTLAARGHDVVGIDLSPTAVAAATAAAAERGLPNATFVADDITAFTGYDVSYVRFLQFCLGAFFAGIAGALSVINFEFVSSEAVSLASSGGVLIAVVLGGSRYFAGPVAGAIAYVLFVSLFSTLSEAWMFYLGALFLLVIRFVPDGLAGGLVALGAAWRHSERNQRIATIAHGLSMSSVAIGAVGLVEALYRSAKPEHATTISTIPGQHGLGQIESLTVPLILLLAGVTVLVFFQRRRSPVPKRKGDD